MALLDHFDPEAVTTELAGKVSARTRHVCVLLGAGAARAAGLPDLQGLQAAVLESLEGAHKKLVEKLFETKNLEETLSYLRFKKLFDRWVKAGDSEVKQRILDYNEDDCRATRVLLDGIRALPIKNV